MFSGTSFSYDGVLSDDFNIKILDFEGIGKFETNILSATVNTTKPARSKKFYRVGSNYAEPVPFTLSVVSETALDDYSRRVILAWLCNRNDFKEFRVYQPDLEQYYYKALFSNANAIYISGKCYGFSLSGIFDSPYQYGDPVVVQGTVTGTSVSDSTAVLDIYNESDIPDGFVYPKIYINSPSNLPTAFTIHEKNPETGANTSRAMTISSGILSSVPLTIDCNLKTITYSDVSVSMSRFTGTWTRFVSGKNKIGVTGLIVGSTITVECPTYALAGF